MPKSSLRQKLLKQRQLIDETECLQRSRAVQQNLLTRAEYIDATTLALYVPIRNEVRTDDIFSAALAAGKKVCFPRVVGYSLEFVDVDGSGCFQPGCFGVSEPVGASIRPITEIELMVVPGVGFDRAGYRLGYGQGYYDRAVSVARPTVMAGLAYDFQVVDVLPKEEHDVCLDLLVMDSDVLVVGTI